MKIDADEFIPVATTIGIIIVVFSLLGHALYQDYKKQQVKNELLKQCNPNVVQGICVELLK
jgi:hypothetical protein